MKNENTIDQNKLKAFVFDNILPSTRGAMSIIMAIIGDKLGLFKAMCDYGPVTAETLSIHTGMHQRYLQEWLSALAAAHWIDYDPQTEEFHLTPEQATVFVDSNSLMYFQGVFGIFDACHLDLKKIISAFKSGQGISWNDREKCLFCSLADSSGPKYKNQLISAWLPKLPGIVSKLNAGAKVADVGCGSGLTTLLMAEAFPNSEFYGFDLHAGSIEQAKTTALETGLALGAQAAPARLQQVTSEAGFNHFSIVYKTMSHMVIHVN
ncbi:class I SAM-dependent methyltransferase [Candidatus Berkiella cookevillensis]|uniref:Class I SAM-dependent methyltransferase n=1 Tax=Candidatus Berkiella cookevillensis TaxID=437022 RepID=A0A0Q9YD55_9GAMM|nr:class I SAM-dependent methyltransferase [Candidatus Berkiella cookevillensis]MCS5707935.1 class I SAM-dependent methyltransferase [Candidatus Berkiella cookevillensis]